jgi:hypothetical protein
VATTLSIPKKLKPRAAKDYPPQIFKTRLGELIETHPDKPSTEDIAATLSITPVTMRKYLSGGSIPLVTAMQLAHVLTGHLPTGPLSVEDIWEVRT